MEGCTVIAPRRSNVAHHQRIELLYDKLKVRTLNDLRRAIETGRLRELRGFGPVIEQKLLGGLEKPKPARWFKLS